MRTVTANTKLGIYFSFKVIQGVVFTKGVSETSVKVSLLSIRTVTARGYIHKRCWRNISKKLV